MKLPQSELIKIRAQALAGTGRLPEALILHQQCRDQPDCPEWMFKTRVGELYSLDRQYDAALAYYLEAANESPTTITYLDVADTYLRRKRNASKARAALAKVDADCIPQMGRYFIHRTYGILAYIEGDTATARQELEKAQAMVEAQKSLPFRDGTLSILKAYLACVLGRQGNMDPARRYFAEAEPYLTATKETELICECKMILNLV